jgi:predicted RNase H-like nuclease (RuvC/YqgF family)
MLKRSKKAQIALEESEKKIESMEKELEQQRRAVDENRIAFNEIKTRVAAYKKSGVNLPSSFTQTINEFQGAQKRVRELTHEIKVKRMRHEELLEERNKYQVDMLKSKVINRTGWRGHNSVRFRLISPEIELEYNPKNKSQEQVFMLEKLAGLEDEYQIVIKNLKKAKRS